MNLIASATNSLIAALKSTNLVSSSWDIRLPNSIKTLPTKFLSVASRSVGSPNLDSLGLGNVLRFGTKPKSQKQILPPTQAPTKSYEDGNGESCAFIDRILQEVQVILRSNYFLVSKNGKHTSDIAIFSKWLPNDEVLKLSIDGKSKTITILKPNSEPGESPYIEYGAIRADGTHEVSVMYRAIRQYLSGIDQNVFIPYKNGVNLRAV